MTPETVYTDHGIDSEVLAPDNAIVVFKSLFKTPLMPKYISDNGKSVTFEIKDHLKAGDYERLAISIIRANNLPLEAYLRIYKGVVNGVYTNTAIDLEVKNTFL